MRRTLLALSFLALVLVVALVASVGLGLAQGNQPVPNARPTPTAIPLPAERAPAAPESPAAGWIYIFPEDLPSISGRNWGDRRSSGSINSTQVKY